MNQSSQFSFVFLDNMSLDERLVFANVVKMLASTAPVNSLIPYVYATSLADLRSSGRGQIK